MFDTLIYIGKKFNCENILWGVGASLLLNHYGLVEKPNDIDILVDENDIGKADKILREIGEKKYREKVSTYATQYFFEYTVNGTDVDVMAGLAMNHSRGVYRHIFDQSSISEIKEINGVNIPFTSLEDWYVIYQLIPNREDKVKMVEEYLSVNGVKSPELLKRALKGELPDEVRINIERLIEY